LRANRTGVRLSRSGCAFQAGGSVADPIPVIDLFAGPGGLSEGFASLGRPENKPAFQIRLSIEKDEFAHKTLQLRAFVRQFPHGNAPDEYYDALRNIGCPLDERLRDLYGTFRAQFACVEDEAWRAELGKEDPAKVHRRVSDALDGARDWVLLGGPPCQAYSLAGRSRNKGVADYRPETDKRQFLYLEYLQIIVDHEPAVFVMENVKGLLSATVNEQRIFDRIMEDLHEPAKALTRERRKVRRGAALKNRAGYRVYSLVQHGLFGDLDLRDFVVRMENFGVPQARHRIILLGIRDDLAAIPRTLMPAKRVKLREVISDLPRLRSGLSRTDDSPDAWLRELRSVEQRPWFLSGANGVAGRIHDTLQRMRVPRNDRGAEFLRWSRQITHGRKWYHDERLGGVLNHSARAHIASDLHRYLFAACYGTVYRRSPTLAAFPRSLLPRHVNVGQALTGSNFADRFRVQLSGRPATTVTCHIAKDGHYFIHPDPGQCRSLSVREAARIQTFPDNYFLVGPRTMQYTQVGNAVPPLLALEIAKIVRDVLCKGGRE
jgi:DNA (cytosine-5)-methyltransferase 1